MPSPLDPTEFGTSPSTIATAGHSPCSASAPAAWKVVPRDRYIGWTPQLREKNLPLVIDNSWFLILPWVTVPNLASYILAIVRRRLPDDWAERYKHHARAYRDLRRDTALQRCALQGFGMDPCRNHQGTRTLRHTQKPRSTEEGHLALAAPKRREANPQPMTKSSAIPWQENAYLLIHLVRGF